MRESQYQAYLIELLRELLPGCYILKTDANYIQGFPDLLILFNDKWGVLEVKRSLREPYQPNQEYYLDELNKLSFAAMICPENQEDVLHALQATLRARRPARLSQRKQVQLG